MFIRIKLKKIKILDINKLGVGLRDKGIKVYFKIFKKKATFVYL